MGLKADPGRRRYCRQTPSPRYCDLLASYRQLHTTGETALGLSPEATFSGKSLLPHAPAIRRWVQHTHSRRLLDYGAGKGQQYLWRDIPLANGEVAPDLKGYWGVDEITLYDPGFAPLSQLPEEVFDGVICTDVLEHCPEEDLPWIVDELFSRARHFVYASVACYPAKKSLPSGDNVHVTVRPPPWWEGMFAASAWRHGVAGYCLVATTKARPPWRPWAKPQVVSQRFGMEFGGGVAPTPPVPGGD
ncbi:MAG: class I SAM-dependent methyltransferase [Candidatus Competibacterales bacterium]